MALRTPLPVQPNLYMTDTAGRPLDGGKVYFGEAGKDPELYPIDVFYDELLTIAAPQPVITKNGFLSASSNTVGIYGTAISYSVKVLDAHGVQVLYLPNMSRLDDFGAVLAAESARAQSAEQELQTTIDNAVTTTQQSVAELEAKTADDVSILQVKDASLQNQINSVGGGKKAYTTEALMIADKANITANSSVDVTNDPTTSKNGTYTYNGTVFTKSVYDPQAVILSKVVNAFDTKAIMEASGMPDGSFASVRKDSTLANNGDYKKVAGVWSLATGDAFSRAKVYADVNPLFKPRALTNGEDLDNLTNGFYHIPSPAIASSLINLPEGMTTPEIGYLFAFREDGVAYQHIVHYTSVAVEEFKRVGNGLMPGFAYKPWQKELELSDVQALIASTAASNGILVSSEPNTLNFDHINNQLVVTANKVRAVYGKSSILLAGQTIPYPANGSQLIVLNKSTNTLSFVAAAIPITDDQVIVGGFAASFKLVFGIDNYSVNGASVDKKIFTGKLIGEPSAVNFDFAGTGKLLIAAYQARVLAGNDTFVLPAKELVLPPINDAAWYHITYVTATGLIGSKKTSVVLTGDEIILGYVQGSTRTVIGFDTYYVNGQPVTQGQSDLLTTELMIVSGVTDANYKQTTDLPEFNTFLSTATHADVYAKYDALVTAYPNYVSRSLLGNDKQGVPIYRYDFKAKPLVAETHSGYLPKIIAVSAVHGFEKAGVMNLFNTLKNICDNWETSEYLETLRWNCHFIVVPIAVPYGFNNMSRHNSNAIDIARNFPADWELGTVGTPTYGGTAPLTEIESQLLNNLMLANKDAIYFMSHHNFGGAPEPAQFIWNASATKFGVRLGKMLISRVSRNLKARYTWVSSYPDGYIGISNINSPKGSEGKQATAHGIQGGTFEIGDNLVYATDKSINSSIVATVGVEVLTNWLLLNLEYSSELYNSKVRL